MVEQSWEQITVKFYNRDYFSKFVEALMARYTALKVWNDPRRLRQGSVTSCSGLQVRLSLCAESRTLTINDLGASSWVMGLVMGFVVGHGPRHGPRRGSWATFRPFARTSASLVCAHVMNCKTFLSSSLSVYLPRLLNVTAGVVVLLTIVITSLPAIVSARRMIGSGWFHFSETMTN